MDEVQKAPSDPKIPDLSGAIEKILAHPELIASVAAVLGKAPPVDPPPSEEERSVAEEAPVSAPASTPSVSPEAIAAIAPLLSGLGKQTSDDPRACLLRALKPYLNPGRREAIDTMIRLSALSELFRGRGAGSGGGH